MRLFEALAAQGMARHETLGGTGREVKVAENPHKPGSMCFMMRALDYEGWAIYSDLAEVVHFLYGGADDDNWH